MVPGDAEELRILRGTDGWYCWVVGRAADDEDDDDPGGDAGG
jgi:hypothetical protein